MSTFSAYYQIDDPDAGVYGTVEVEVSWPILDHPFTKEDILDYHFEGVCDGLYEVDLDDIVDYLNTEYGRLEYDT